MYTVPLLEVARRSFSCAICYDLFTDPESLPCGHVFCRACILRSLGDRLQCPLCNGAVRSQRSLVPLRNLAALSLLLQDAVLEGAALAAEVEGQEQDRKLSQRSERGWGTSPVAPSLPSAAGPTAAGVASTQRLSSLSPPPPAPPGPLSDPVGGETPDLTRRGPTPPLAPEGTWVCQLVPPAVRATHSQHPTLVHLRGPCVLCALDIMDRLSVRDYLRAMLSSTTANCAREELAGLTESHLGELLGPLWAVRCGEPRQPKETWRTALAHHNCLAWAGVLQTYTSKLFGAQRRRTPHVLPYSVALAAGPPSPLRALTRHLAGCPPDTAARLRCYLCDRAEEDLPGVALRPCEGVARCGRYFHYPCALLAGAASCLVVGLEDHDTELATVPLDGEERLTAAEGGGGEKRPRAEPVEVWCGECHRRGRRGGP